MANLALTSFDTIFSRRPNRVENLEAHVPLQFAPRFWPFSKRCKWIRITRLCVIISWIASSQHCVNRELWEWRLRDATPPAAVFCCDIVDRLFTAAINSDSFFQHFYWFSKALSKFDDSDSNLLTYCVPFSFCVHIGACMTQFRRGIREARARMALKEPPRSDRPNK